MSTDEAIAVEKMRFEIKSLRRSIVDAMMRASRRRVSIDDCGAYATVARRCRECARR